MSSIRETLLQKQKEAELTIHEGKESLPQPVSIYRKELNSLDEEIETKDYVSYDPSTDKFKIYCKSRSIEFSGLDFRWIFEFLASIGTEIPVQTVTFVDGEISTPVSVFCGETINQNSLPEIDNPETFEGWFLDEDFIEPFLISTQIKENFSVFAKRTGIQ